MQTPSAGSRGTCVAVRIALWTAGCMCNVGGVTPPPPGVGHKGPRCPGLQRAGGGLCLPPHWNPHPPGHDPRHDVRPRVRTTRGIGFAPSCTRLGVFSPHWVRPGQVQTLPGRNRNSSHTLGRAVRWAVSCGATPHGPWTSQEGSEQRSPFGRNPMRTPPARCARCRGRFPPPGTYPRGVGYLGS